MTAPTLVSATGTFTSSAVNLLDVALPVGRVSGQLMGMHLTSVGGLASTPAGWTLRITNAPQTGHYLLTRVTDAAEGSTVRWNFASTGQRGEACILLIDGYNPTFDVLAFSTTQNITNPTPLPTGTTLVNDSLLIGAFGTFYDASMGYAPASGWTEQYDHDNGSTFGASLAIYSKTQAVAGAVGGDTFVPTQTHTGDKATPILWSVRPAGGATPSQPPDRTRRRNVPLLLR